MKVRATELSPTATQAAILSERAAACRPRSNGPSILECPSREPRPCGRGAACRPRLRPLGPLERAPPEPPPNKKRRPS
eukprot:9469172-Pyramimonas_sp.AAC.1